MSSYDDASEPLEVQRRLADTLQAFRRDLPKLTELFSRFRWASLMLGDEVLAWALEPALMTKPVCSAVSTGVVSLLEASRDQHLEHGDIALEFAAVGLHHRGERTTG